MSALQEVRKEKSVSVGVRISESCFIFSPPVGNTCLHLERVALRFVCVGHACGWVTPVHSEQDLGFS